jgi:DNA-binding response OmpR family regulator
MTPSVLIADDDGLIAAVILRILGLMDLKGVVVSDGLVAIATAQAMNESLVCVILDVMMPGRSGIEAAKEIRRFAPTLPIIIMSGVISQDLLDRTKGIEHLTVVTKPFTISELRSILGKILQKQQE